MMKMSDNPYVVFRNRSNIFNIKELTGNHWNFSIRGYVKGRRIHKCSKSISISIFAEGYVILKYFQGERDSTQWIRWSTIDIICGYLINRIHWIQWVWTTKYAIVHTIHAFRAPISAQIHDPSCLHVLYELIMYL